MKYKNTFVIIIFSFSLLLLAGCATDYTNTIEPTTVSINTLYLKALPENISVKDSSLDIEIKLSVKKESSPIVTADLIYQSYIAKSFSLYDDGLTTHSDKTAGDSIYSVKIKLDSTQKNGAYQLRYYVSAANQSEQFAGQQSFNFFNGKNSPPVISELSAPDSITVTSDPVDFLLSVKTADPDGISDIAKVYFIFFRPDGTTGTNPIELNDLGQSGDALPRDGIYSVGLSMNSASLKGAWRFEFRAKDQTGALSNLLIHNLIVK